MKINAGERYFLVKQYVSMVTTIFEKSGIRPAGKYALGELFVPARKAINYSLNSNSTELEQVLHTDGTS